MGGDASEAEDSASQSSSSPSSFPPSTPSASLCPSSSPAAKSLTPRHVPHPSQTACTITAIRTCVPRYRFTSGDASHDVSVLLVGGGSMYRDKRRSVVLTRLGGPRDVLDPAKFSASRRRRRRRCTSNGICSSLAYPSTTSPHQSWYILQRFSSVSSAVRVRSAATSFEDDGVDHDAGAEGPGVRRRPVGRGVGFRDAVGSTWFE